MQIRLGTARGVGYSGDAEGLLDPDTNLTYAVKYLAGAYRAAGCDADRAVSYYQRGYYGAARRECGAPLPATAAVAVDVIKPKVVRTETIATPKSGLAPARPVGNFEPARVAPPPVQPVVASNPLPAKQQQCPRWICRSRCGGTGSIDGLRAMPRSAQFEPRQADHRAAPSGRSRL